MDSVKTSVDEDMSYRVLLSTSYTPKGRTPELSRNQEIR